MTKPTSKSGAEAGPTDFKAKLAELRAQLPAGPALDEAFDIEPGHCAFSV